MCVIYETIISDEIIIYYNCIISYWRWKIFSSVHSLQNNFSLILFIFAIINFAPYLNKVPADITKIDAPL